MDGPDCSAVSAWRARSHRQAFLEVAAGLTGVSPGDTNHRHGGSDDHVRKLGEQVIAASPASSTACHSPSHTAVMPPR